MGLAVAALGRRRRSVGRKKGGADDLLDEAAASLDKYILRFDEKLRLMDLK